MRTFRDSIKQMSPPWLQGPWGEKLLYTFGLFWDAIIDSGTLAVKARYPAETCVGGLAVLGRERGISRGIVESKSAYATRLTQWIDDRKMKGSPYALLRQIRGYLSGVRNAVRVVNNQGAWFGYDTDGLPFYSRGTNWNWDGDNANWSRFWLIIYTDPTGDFAPKGTSWGDDIGWGTDDTWGGSNVSCDVGISIKEIVKQWTPPHARCEFIIWVFNNSVLSSNGSGPGYPQKTWGNWGTDEDSVRVIARNTEGLYFLGNDA